MIMQGAKGKSKSFERLFLFYYLVFFLVPAVYNFMLAFSKDSAPPQFRTLLRGGICKAQLYIK